MQPITADFDALPARRRIAGPFLNLLRKEWGAARASVLSAVCIFGLVPLIWGLIYLAIDWGHEPAVPFGLVLLTLAGWLYAIVVGANTVCRDWGRAEEHFLLARPVTPPMAIAAKLLTGAGVVAIAWASAMLCDLLSFVLPQAMLDSGSRGPRTAPSFLLLPLCGLLVSYLLAFAAAVITRRTLHATLLAGLALFVWAAAPLSVRGLYFLHPEPGSVYRAAQDGLSGFCEGNWRFLLTTACVVAAGLAASFLASTREHRLSVGYKPLAWVFALVVLALFVGATREVGNSMTVIDRRYIPREPGMPASFGGDMVVFASNGDQCFGISRYECGTPGTEKRGRLTTRDLVSFRVSDRGKIENLRTARMYFSPEPERFPEVTAPIQPKLQLMTHLASFAAAPANELVLTGAVQQRNPPRLARVRIAWPVGEQPRVSSMQETVPPDGWHTRCFLLRYATTDKYAYAEYGIRREKTDSPENWTKILCKYEWTDAKGLDTLLAPVADYEPGSGEYANLLFGTQRSSDQDQQRLKWYRATLVQGSEDGVYTRDFVLDDTLVGPLQAVPEGNARRWYEGFGDPGWIEWVPRGDLVLASDRLGLRLFKITNHETDIVGEYRASSLATLLRGQTTKLTLLEGGRVAEISGQTLSVYDISDPKHPRRTGFFNLHPRNEAGDVLAAGKYLVVRQITWPGPDELLVLDQPEKNTQLVNQP